MTIFLTHTFNSSFSYIDDVMSLHNSPFSDYLHLIYANNLEAKNTIDTQMSAFYLDFHLDIAKEK